MINLSKRQLEVKNLRDRGLTHSEIANALGISPTNVSVVIYNIRHKLRQAGGGWEPPVKALPMSRHSCRSDTGLRDAIRACRQLGWQTWSIAHVLQRSVDEIHALEART